MIASLAFVFTLMFQEHWPEGRGVVPAPTGERISWYGTLAAGTAEAARQKKPLLLVAAAPECQNTPGVW